MSMSASGKRKSFEEAPGSHLNTLTLEEVIIRQSLLAEEEDDTISEDDFSEGRRKMTLRSYAATSPRATVMFCVIIIVAFTGLLGMIVENLYCFINHKRPIDTQVNYTDIIDVTDFKTDPPEPTSIFDRELREGASSSTDTSDNEPHQSSISSHRNHGGTVTVTSTDFIHITASDTYPQTPHCAESTQRSDVNISQNPSTSSHTRSSSDFQTTMSAATSVPPGSDVTYCPYTAHPDIYTPCVSHPTTLPGGIVTSPALTLHHHNPLGKIMKHLDLAPLRRAVNHYFGNLPYQVHHSGLSRRQLREHENDQEIKRELDTTLLQIDRNKRDLQVLRRQLEHERRKLDDLQLRLEKMKEIKRTYDDFLESMIPELKWRIARAMDTEHAMPVDRVVMEQQHRRRRKRRDFNGPGSVGAE